MNPNLKWKGLFIAAVIVFCFYFLFGYPTFPTSFAQVKDNFNKQIKLGLDLQGGSHMILQVQSPATKSAASTIRTFSSAISTRRSIRS